MPVDWTPFVEFVKRHRKFMLTTHVRPDGDGLGSMLALAESLRDQGKQVTSVVASSLPQRYAFLDPNGTVARFLPPGEQWLPADAVIVLDTGTYNQLGDLADFLRRHKPEIAVIDHHLTQDHLGEWMFIDTEAEATGRLAYEAIQSLGGRISESAANALFVALAMDTGWFRHSNTTARTFELSAELVRCGARPDYLYDQLFEQNSLARMQLMGRVLDRLQLAIDNRVAYTEIRREDYEATGALPQDSEDLVNFTRSIAGVEVGLLFMEQPRGGIKISFRSREQVDVAKLAEQFGGGGHRRASGAILHEPLETVREKVLAAVEKALHA
ncbi:MAG: phosphodiesterase [Gemmatales bacterium]|nr:MAG: phosphodiesterase [Gemmatales bacterium]